jgi:hypothetical protein
MPIIAWLDSMSDILRQVMAFVGSLPPVGRVALLALAGWLLYRMLGNSRL